MIFSEEDEKYLSGLALGDGTIRKRSKNSYCLSVSHCDKQFSYLKSKADRIGQILNRPINIRTFFIKSYKTHRIEIYHSFFGSIYERLYVKEGKKFITLSFLQSLSDEAVAHWYMDDGSLIAKKQNGRQNSKEVVFSMYASESESLNAIQFFKERFDADFTVKRNKGRHSVRCGLRAARKILGKLQEFKCKGMEYKFLAE